MCQTTNGREKSKGNEAASAASGTTPRHTPGARTNAWRFTSRVLAARATCLRNAHPSPSDVQSMQRGEPRELRFRREIFKGWGNMRTSDSIYYCIINFSQKSKSIQGCKFVKISLPSNLSGAVGHAMPGEKATLAGADGSRVDDRCCVMLGEGGTIAGHSRRLE